MRFTTTSLSRPRMHSRLPKANKTLRSCYTGVALMKPFQPPQFLRGIEKSMIRKISDRAKPGSISLGLGEPDLPTPEVIIREAVRVIQEEKSGYTLQAGIPALSEKIASDYPHMNLSL